MSYSQDPTGNPHGLEECFFDASAWEDSTPHTSWTGASELRVEGTLDSNDGCDWLSTYP